jgi:hypothetical protein
MKGTSMVKMVPNKSVKIVGPTSQKHNSNLFKKTKATEIAMTVGKIVIPVIDIIFTTIFLGFGIIAFAFEQESLCEQI